MNGEPTVSSGGRPGSAPGDRDFRPDVQGLRALAVLLVVLFHGGFHVSGGYVGVDVFFVISGFVITGLLLRERKGTGRISIPVFYARRARRIIPAATLVIVAVVLASNHLLGNVLANATADDGRWVAAFLANFHFASAGTNYLASQRPPSPLQNFWSLAVEEQFYLVYPALFLFVAWVTKREKFERRLARALTAVAIASFSFSVFETSVRATTAYFSPFTRAWELALGALVALSSRHLRNLSSPVMAAAAWTGMTMVVSSAFVLSANTSYPGSAVALPVIGTALVISGGTACPAWGPEALLRLRPVQWLGQISYSLYLWHWPILTIAAERKSVTSLSLPYSAVLILLSVVLAAVTFKLIEDPIRHMRVLSSRRWLSIAFGGVLVASAVAVSSVEVGAPESQLAALSSVIPAKQCIPPSASQLASLRSKALTDGMPPKKEDTATLLVVGDSTACTMLPGLEVVAPSYGLHVQNAAVIGCGVVSNALPSDVIDSLNFYRYTRDCATSAQNVELSALRRLNPKVVLWSSIWERDPILGGDGRTLTTGSREWRSTLLGRIEKRVFEFSSAGAFTVFLLQPPIVPSASSGQAPPSTTDYAFAQLDALLRGFAATHPSEAAVIDLSSLVCPAGPPCPYYVSGVAVRPDDEHYSPESSLWVAQWLMPRIVTNPLVHQRASA